MDNLFVLRGKMQDIYGRHSRVFDKLLQFILAFATFYLINSNIGFMKVLAQATVTFALSVICTFFPMVVTVLAAAVLVLGHMYAASVGFLMVTGIIFLIMFIFYFRLTPKMALAVLLTPIAFALKIPYVIPIAYALVSGPVTLIALFCGIVVFYMMQYVKSAVPALQGEESAGLAIQISAYVKQVFLNKQMWIVVVAFIISFLLVYTIRKQAADHAWKIAIAAGAVVNIVIVAGGNIVLGEQTAYGSLIIGSLCAVLIGLILEFFFFSVDYTRSERMQFEDDEYYYYVKAIPKLAVSTHEKTIKRISERQEMNVNEVEIPEKMKTEISNTRNNVRSNKQRRPSPARGPVTKKQDMDEVDKELLSRSLKRDLGMDE